jgi:hypothetical protein
LGLFFSIVNGTTFADRPLRLILEQHLSNVKIPISTVCPNSKKAAALERTGSRFQFADTKRPDKQTLSTKNLPKFNTNEPYLEGYFLISSAKNENLCVFIVSTVPKGTVKYVLPRLDEYGCWG